MAHPLNPAADAQPPPKLVFFNTTKCPWNCGLSVVFMCACVVLVGAAVELELCWDKELAGQASACMVQLHDLTSPTLLSTHQVQC